MPANRATAAFPRRSPRPSPTKRAAARWPTGSEYFNDQGVSCAAAGACYQVQTALNPVAGNCTRLTIQVTPVATPNRQLDYAVVLPPP